MTFPVRFAGPREFLAEWERSLSKGGMFVDTRTPAAFGTTVRIELELPGGAGTVPILGQVAVVMAPDAKGAKRPGMGVRFRLEPQVEQALRSFVHRLSRGSNAGRVLVVDDDALIVAQLGELLSANGFSVKTAPNAIRALDALKYESFDAILSDLTMPRMDGFEFKDNLQQDPRTKAIPFILITSSTDDETRETAKRLGATAFIAKPVAQEPLFSVLRKAIADYAASGGGAGQPPPKTRSAAAAVRDRRIVEIAFRKMKSLGMDVRFTADEQGVAGMAKVSLVNAFTHARIDRAGVRNVAHDKVRFTSPPHLASLPDLPILDLSDAAAFERAVAAAYAARAESQVRAKAELEKFRLPIELDEPGFRVVSRVKIGMDEVTFSVFDAKTILLESLNGKHFGPVMGEGARKIDVSDATSGVDVELELGTVLRQYRPELERLAKEAELRAAKERKEWLEEEPAPAAAPAARAPAAPPPDRARFAKPGEFRLDEPAPEPPPPEPPELLLTELEPEPEPEPELATLDPGALESLDDPPPVPAAEPVALELDVAALEAEPAAPPPAGDAMALVCSTCGSSYSLGDEVEDERLLTSCADCIAAGNALT